MKVAVEAGLVEQLRDDRLDDLRDEVADDQDHEEADQVRDELEQRIESLLQAGGHVYCDERLHLLLLRLGSCTSARGALRTAGGVKGLSRGSREWMDEAAQLRIGELSYRVGVSPDVLRAWEKRYGLLRPSRSEGGYRLYSERDEWRIRLMQQKLWSGLSTAEAARDVARMDDDSELPDGSVETPSELARRLGEALESFDEETAHE